MTIVQEDLLENVYIEAQEFLLESENRISNEDISRIKSDLAIDLEYAAKYFVSTYNGHNDFIVSLRGSLVRYGNLSVAQIRGALNFMRSDLQRGKMKVHQRTSGSLIPLVTPSAPEPVDCDEESVLKTDSEESLLDVSQLPDGRYAFPDPSGKNDYVFLAVRTIKKRVYRQGRYRWSKFVTGNEWLMPGTVEVRKWSQDAKELVGYQKPGDGYRGKYIDELVNIMQAPKAWALIFGLQVGRCSICGKTLTDEDSRAKGIGPECIKKGDYWGNFKRLFPTQP